MTLPAPARRLLAAAVATLIGVGGVGAGAHASPPERAHPGLDHPVPTTGCGVDPAGAPGTSVDLELVSDGVPRSYRLHVPATYDPHRPTPVILAFHGRKGTGAELEEFSGLSSLPAIVAYPDGLPVDGKTAWAGAPYAPPVDDVRFVSELLDELQSTMCVDRDAVFATGKSNGGGFTALLACQMSNRIAAFAPVAGAFYPQSREGCRSRRPVPMLEFHGVSDTIIEYAGGESHGEPFPAVMDWLDGWVDRAHCRSFTQERIGPDVTHLAWSDCGRHADVEHYRVDGAGHTWPGELSDSGPGSATQTISATEVMWEFFQEHRRHP